MKREEEILTVAKELVSFRSTHDRPDEMRRCVEYVKEYLADAPLLVNEVKLAGQPGLVISFHRRKKQELLLVGHLDVVEGFDTQFVAERKGERIYGRGTNDMKGSCAVMLVLMKHLALQKRKPRIALLLVTDEETGGLGTRELVKRGYTGEFVIVGEPTKLRIETKHKGHLAVKVTAYGSSSHGSRPWLGNNAIEKLIRQLRKLQEEIPQATRGNKWLPTINVTSFLSESPFNVTPSKAEMVLDIRTTEEWTNRRILNTMKRLNLKFQKIHDGGILTNKRKDIHIRTLRKIADKVVGKFRKYVKSCGSTDARYFSAKGIPVAVIGPTGNNHHKHNEYVEIPAMHQFYEILQRYVKENVKS